MHLYIIPILFFLLQPVQKQQTRLPLHIYSMKDNVSIICSDKVGNCQYSSFRVYICVTDLIRSHNAQIGTIAPMDQDFIKLRCQFSIQCLHSQFSLSDELTFVFIKSKARFGKGLFFASVISKVRFGSLNFSVRIVNLTCPTTRALNSLNKASCLIGSLKISWNRTYQEHHSCWTPPGYYVTLVIVNDIFFFSSGYSPLLRTSIFSTAIKQSLICIIFADWYFQVPMLLEVYWQYPTEVLLPMQPVHGTPPTQKLHSLKSQQSNQSIQTIPQQYKAICIRQRCEKIRYTLARDNQ